MSKSRGMQVAADMARRARDAAAAELARGRTAEQGARRQFDQLDGYASETESRWTAQSRVLATPALMSHHYAFMARLHHAIGLQREVLGQHARQIEILAARLRQAELRLSSLRMVLDRQRLDTERAANRREQKQTDETAATLFRRTAAAAAPQEAS